MNELIKITTEQVGSASIETVDARELHKFLESRQDFSTWIKKRITDLGFVEGEDFIRLHKKMEANNATIIEYHLSLEMGKHLGMLEKNKKGKEVRDYFIDCEAKLKQQSSLVLPENFQQALLALAAEVGKTTAYEAQIEADKPKVDFALTFKASVNSVGMKEFADRLGIKGLGRNNLFKELRKSGYLTLANIPYRRFIESGLFELDVTDFEDPDGNILTKSVTKVTPKGQIVLEKYFRVGV